MMAPSGSTVYRHGSSLRAWQPVAAWVIGAILYRALLASLVPLFPDETYYWEWSRRLAAGYFDHPPGIAFLIAAGTALVGQTTAGVRTGPALMALVTHVAAIGCAWSMAGRGAPGLLAARRAAQLVALLPIAAVGLVLATPDALLFAAVMVALLAVERALAAPPGTRASLRWWIFAGIGTGGAFLAKYTAVLLPMGLFIAFLLHPVLRRRFREAGPWLASALALAMFMPVVLWNARHDWLSFRFQLAHGFGTNAVGSPLSRELEMVGGQAGLASPILFALMVGVVWVALRDGWKLRTAGNFASGERSERRFALAMIALVPLLFFAISAWRRSVEANWPALIYPSALTLLATSDRSWTRGIWWRRGLWLAALLIAVVGVQAWRPILPLAPRNDPIARAYGWVALARFVDSARDGLSSRGAETIWLAAERYQEASELAFHVAGQPKVTALNLGGRHNQYDLWISVCDLTGTNDGVVAVFDAEAKGDSLAAVVGDWFASKERGATVVLRRGGSEIARRRVWSYRGVNESFGRWCRSRSDLHQDILSSP